MRYFIVYPINEPAKENDYKIVKVQEADEANFWKVRRLSYCKR